MKAHLEMQSLEVQVNEQTVKKIENVVIDVGCIPLSELSAKQVDVLRFIKRQIQDVGIAPSMREISEACAIKSTSNVAWHLGKLSEAGYLKLISNAARGIVLTPAGQAVPA